MENIITFTNFENFLIACGELTKMNIAFSAKEGFGGYTITITGY